MEKIKKVLKNTKAKERLQKLVIVSFVVLMYAVPIFAGNIGDVGSKEFDNVIFFIAGWAAKVGMAIALFGAIEWVGGFRSDDAEKKSKGMKMAASGFMTAAICAEATIKLLFGIG